MKKTIYAYLFVHRLHAGGWPVPTSWATLFCILSLAFLAWNLDARVSHAQDNTPSNSASETASEAALEVSDDEVKAVAQDLWCPLCSGVRLDTCELKACEQMRQEIAIQLANGQSPESIKAYFLEQYGPQVLGEPPREGFNLLAWIVPFAVLLGAAAVLLFRSRRLLSQRLDVQTAGNGRDTNFFEDDEDEDEAPKAMPAAEISNAKMAAEDSAAVKISDDLQHDAHPVQQGEPTDSYEHALDEELRQYES